MRRLAPTRAAAFAAAWAPTTVKHTQPTAAPAVPSTAVSATASGRRSFGTTPPRLADTCPQKLRTVRDPKYGTITEEDIAAFTAILGKAGVVLDDRLQSFNTDWFDHYHGCGTVALLPRTTEEVSAVMKHCHARRLAVVPQGGNTGFVGGSVPVFDEVVLSLRRMDQVVQADTLTATAVVEAGCILEPLDNHLREKYGLMSPVDLGAKGSCTIGGNIATNAGGVRFMRYGSLHGNVLGLKVVLANGEVLDCMNTLRKDNTGYDLKQLFVGSEGTLGIVTEIALQCPVAPENVQTMFLSFDSWDALCRTYLLARQHMAEVLSAVEMIDGEALRMCLDIEKLPSPLEGTDGAYYLLLETNGSNVEHDKAKLEGFLETAMAADGVTNGILAQSGVEAQNIWKMRENCALSPAKVGHVRWYDISMPSDKMRDLTEEVRAALREAKLDEKGKIIAFGHFGDGNLHLNVVCVPAFDAEVCDLVDKTIYAHSKARRYSVSAEHGIGIQKKAYLGYSKAEHTVDVMRQVKHLFDPQGILNPYKLL